MLDSDKKKIQMPINLSRINRPSACPLIDQ